MDIPSQDRQKWHRLHYYNTLKSNFYKVSSSCEGFYFDKKCMIFSKKKRNFAKLKRKYKRFWNCK